MRTEEISDFDLSFLFGDRSIRAKAREKEIGAALLDGRLSSEAFLDFARLQSGPAKTTCLGGLELATRARPELVDTAWFGFLCDALEDDLSSIKREAARIVGNVAQQPPGRMDAALEGLLRNATHDGTVVRWAAAFALCEILSHQPALVDGLLPQVRRLRDHEENSGVKKKYIKALGTAS